MTGIYQCYCQNHVSMFDSFGKDDLCFDYYVLNASGGAYLKSLFGTVIGFLNTGSAKIIARFVSEIKFHTNESREIFVIVLTFVFLFANNGLWAAQVIGLNKWSQIEFYQLYGGTFLFATAMTLVTAYVGNIIDIFKNKFYYKKKRSDEPFPLETKLAIILNTVFVTFTYGFPMPLLYLCCVFPLLVLSVCDKLLVTYWAKPAPKHSDKQMRVFTNILKYAPFFCLLQCGWTYYHLGAMYSPQPIATF